MATFTYFTAADYASPMWYGSITSKTTASVTWANSSNSTLFGGVFSYGLNGAMKSGLITDIHQSIGGVPYMEASGLSFAMNAQTNWSLAKQADFVLKFFAGNDLINGSAFADVLHGYAGNDTIYGGDGNDTIYGADFDSINGGAGDDTFNLKGYVTVDGGAGNDTFYAYSSTITYTESANGGVDTVYSDYTQTLGPYVENLVLTGKANVAGIGGITSNTITGNRGQNQIMGMAGNDTLDGGAGNDTIGGGAGNDVLTGGTGNDAFYFDSPAIAANRDVITDFSHTGGNMDKIHLDFDVYRIGGAGGHGLKAADFWDMSQAAPGKDYHVMYDKSSGALYYDADGTGKTAPVQIATVGTTTHPTLTFQDFYVTY